MLHWVKSFQSFPRIFKHNTHCSDMEFGSGQGKKKWLHLHMGIILIPWPWDLDHFWIRHVQSAAGLSVQLSALSIIQAWWWLHYFMKLKKTYLTHMSPYYCTLSHFVSHWHQYQPLSLCISSRAENALCLLWEWETKQTWHVLVCRSIHGCGEGRPRMLPQGRGVMKTHVS